MEKEELIRWIKRLIEINKDLKNAQDEFIKAQRVNQIVGYIESLENISI